MKFLKWIVLVLAATPFCAFAADATLAAVSGSVVFTGADGKALNATVGTPLPEGTTVTTSQGGQATVELFSGTVTIVQPDSDVVIENRRTDAESGKESTLLELRKGGLVASLDPAKRGVTDFRVRTPKGTATAHGTIFAVRITPDLQHATIATFSGTVTFVTDQGEISVPFGKVSTDSGAVSVSDAVKANPTLGNDILDATSGVAHAVGDGAVKNTSGSPNLVQTVLSALLDIAFQVAPDRVAETTREVISAAAPALSGSEVKVVETAAVESAQRWSPSSVQEVAGAASDAGGTTVEATATNPILPALDQTQIVASPDRR